MRSPRASRTARWRRVYGNISEWNSRDHTRLGRFDVQIDVWDSGDPDVALIGEEVPKVFFVV